MCGMKVGVGVGGRGRGRAWAWGSAQLSALESAPAWGAVGLPMPGGGVGAVVDVGVGG